MRTPLSLIWKFFKKSIVLGWELVSSILFLCLKSKGLCTLFFWDEVLQVPPAYDLPLTKEINRLDGPSD